MKPLAIVPFGLVAVALAWFIFQGVRASHSVANKVVAERVVRWSSQADALTFDPHAQNEITSITMLQQVYEPLVRRGPDMRLAPALAVSWSAVTPTTWEFKLRPNVRFEGGEPFTADDAVFSLNRAKSRNSAFKTFLERVIRIEKVDDHTIRLITDGPVAILPQNLTNIFIMSQSWAKKNDAVEVQDYASGKENYAVRHGDGTGPFALIAREPGVRTSMARNKAWWGAAQYGADVTSIDYRPIASGSTRVAALLSGELDFVLDPPVQDLDRIRAAPGLKVESATENRAIFLGMNQGARELRSSSVKGRNPFADKRVREAVYRAIDVAAIDRVIMKGQATPAGLLAPPSVDGYTKALDARLPFSPDVSKSLLASAGYPDGFDVTLDCPNNRFVKDEEICVAVAGMLAQVNIKVSVDAQPKTVWGPKIESHATDFYMHGWGIPTFDSENVFTYIYRSDGSWNAAGYKNPAVDKLIDAIVREPDVSKRTAMMQECWRMVGDDVVLVPLHYQKLNWAMSRALDLPVMPDNAPRFFFARIR